MSIIIIAFPAAPKVDPEAKRKDEELNRKQEQKVTGNYVTDQGQLRFENRITISINSIKTIATLNFLDVVKENDDDIEFHAVFQRLSEEEISDLPPGGGLYSK